MGARILDGFDGALIPNREEKNSVAKNSLARIALEQPCDYQNLADGMIKTPADKFTSSTEEVQNIYKDICSCRGEPCFFRSPTGYCG